MPSLKFQILAKCPITSARAGIIETNHGAIETPIFMPVATKGSVRGMPWEIMHDLGAQIVLANTYHLHIRPGEMQIKAAGGLHRWSRWDKPFLTDSGGFQVFSFARRGKAKIDDQGVTFKDDLAGNWHRIGPLESMLIQRDLGADIVMAFDHCPPGNASYDEVAFAVERTNLWTKKCFEIELQKHQNLFPIVQGGRYPDLREYSLKQITSLDAPGYALGGVSVGETREEVDKVVKAFGPLLPDYKPRYVMGVGTPHDLITGVNSGIDMFDCVLPTRLARHGSFFGKEGKVESVTQKAFSDEHELPLMPDCHCPTCLVHSRAYLKHLFLRSELTVYYYLSVHNMYTLLNLTRSMRKAILDGSFASKFAHDSSLKAETQSL
ncbi:MAG: tRNA guanosine(34) transglycosylase Tgt [Candidatus Caenarcaniphilales bacterium]|nr:tRNA guanosine(34) transglycosylase Tgt [Candidatus Caenarcaniphilales bacterium]